MRAEGLGFRVKIFWSLGFEAKGLGFRVPG